MSEPDRDSVERCAEGLLALLEADRRKRRQPSARDRAAGDEAVALLRELDDGALLATLKKIRHAGTEDTRRGGTKATPGAGPEPGRASVALWLVTATLTGAIIMGLELVAFRLYAPYLGYSIYVWGTMISVVMVALSLGYAFGGWLADRSRSDVPLYMVILASAFYQLLIVCTVRALLPSVAPAGEFLGTTVATVIIFVPPMAGLAITGPFVIRLLTRIGHVGVTAGRVYALSTVGSIAGILVTSFLLVPALGTQATLQVACAASAVVGVGGLIRRQRIALVGLAPALLVPLTPEVTWGTNTLWVCDSAYNLVRVVRDGTQLKLVLNNESSIATRREESTGWTGGYYDDFALGPLLVPAKTALTLGMGAGASIASTHAVDPAVEFDAVEIDPKVIEAGTRFFGIDPEDERLNIYIADARPWLAANERRYDLVHVDLYQGGPYIPFYLVTEEFFRSVRAHMTDQALIIMNVLDLSRERDLLNATGATLKRVFPSVVVLSRGRGNHMVYAFAKERSAAEVRATLTRRDGTDPVSVLAQTAVPKITDLDPPLGIPVFTDDWAPVEEMTRRMLADFSDLLEDGGGSDYGWP